MSGAHIGSDFDDFLAEEGVLEEVGAAASNRVCAFKLAREIGNIKSRKSLAEEVSNEQQRRRE